MSLLHSQNIFIMTELKGGKSIDLCYSLFFPFNSCLVCALAFCGCICPVWIHQWKQIQSKNLLNGNNLCSAAQSGLPWLSFWAHQDPLLSPCFVKGGPVGTINIIEGCFCSIMPPNTLIYAHRGGTHALSNLLPSSVCPRNTCTDTHTCTATHKLHGDY